MLCRFWQVALLGMPLVAMERLGRRVDFALSEPDGSAPNLCTGGCRQPMHLIARHLQKRHVRCSSSSMTASTASRNMQRPGLEASIPKLSSEVMDELATRRQHARIEQDLDRESFSGRIVTPNASVQNDSDDIANLIFTSVAHTFPERGFSLFKDPDNRSSEVYAHRTVADPSLLVKGQRVAFRVHVSAEGSKQASSPVWTVAGLATNETSEMTSLGSHYGKVTEFLADGTAILESDEFFVCLISPQVVQQCDVKLEDYLRFDVHMDGEEPTIKVPFWKRCAKFNNTALMNTGTPPSNLSFAYVHETFPEHGYSFARLDPNNMYTKVYLHAAVADPSALSQGQPVALYVHRNFRAQLQAATESPVWSLQGPWELLKQGAEATWGKYLGVVRSVFHDGTALVESSKFFSKFGRDPFISQQVVQSCNLKLHDVICFNIVMEEGVPVVEGLVWKRCAEGGASQISEPVMHTLSSTVATRGPSAFFGYDRPVGVDPPSHLTFAYVRDMYPEKHFSLALTDPNKPSSTVYVHQTAADPRTLSTGQPVAFELHISPKGSMQASAPVWGLAGVADFEGAQAIKWGEFCGNITAIMSDGTASVESSEVEAKFGRGAFINQEVVQSCALELDDVICFNAIMNEGVPVVQVPLWKQCARRVPTGKGPGQGGQVVKGGRPLKWTDGIVRKFSEGRGKGRDARRGKFSTMKWFDSLLKGRSQDRSQDSEDFSDEARHVYAKQLNAFGRSWFWKSAVLLLNEMSDGSVTPDVSNFNAAISACQNDGQLQRALSLLQDMRGAGVSLNMISFGAAISAHGKARQWQPVLSLLEEMDRAALTPSAISFSTAISACGSAEKWEQALLLLDSMHGAGVPPNVITFGAAVSACGRAGQWQRSSSLLKEMDVAGVTVNIKTFGAAIMACERAGQWQPALSLLGDIRRASMTPDVLCFNAAITACEKGVQWQSVLSLVENIKRSGENAMLSYASCYWPTMMALVAAGRLEDAFALLREIEEFVSADKLDFTRAYAIYRMLLVACEQVGDRRAADVQALINHHQLYPREKPSVIVPLPGSKTRSYSNGFLLDEDHH